MGLVRPWVHQGRIGSGKNVLLQWVSNRLLVAPYPLTFLITFCGAEVSFSPHTRPLLHQRWSASPRPYGFLDLSTAACLGRLELNQLEVELGRLSHLRQEVQDKEQAFLAVKGQKTQARLLRATQEANTLRRRRR